MKEKITREFWRGGDGGYLLIAGFFGKMRERSERFFLKKVGGKR